MPRFASERGADSVLRLTYVFRAAQPDLETVVKVTVVVGIVLNYR